MTKKADPPGPKALADTMQHGQERTIVSERVGTVWLPKPSVPANDNEASATWIIGSFLGRHLHWLAPTVLLALMALGLLFLSA